MRLPALLYRRKNNVHKNSFGHVLILAGSKGMLGAAALCSLATMRSGAGLVTVAIPKSLNNTLQRKVSNVVMTLPLAETSSSSLAFLAYKSLKNILPKYQAVAIGPGLSQNPNTRKLILKIIAASPVPVIIDADGLNALKGRLNILLKTPTEKILTPHPGEMSRLMELKKPIADDQRKSTVKNFVQKHRCTLLLKGHKTLVYSPRQKLYINPSGNPGMATAGSGDVLTGMISAFVAQGLSGYEAAKFGAYLHGKAGDWAAKKHSRVSMIASDIVDAIPRVIKS